MSPAPIAADPAIDPVAALDDMRIATCWVWRTGAIEIAVLTGRSKPPRGVLQIVCGPARVIDEAVCVCARLAYDGKTLLVPGIPEADSDDAALDALIEFQNQVRRRLEGRPDVTVLSR